MVAAGLASEFQVDYVRRHFAENFHVRHEKDVCQRQKDRLVLVKGKRGSRLLQRAVRISSTGHDVKGRELKVLSEEMHQTFGSFDGKMSIQCGPPGVDDQGVYRAPT